MEKPVTRQTQICDEEVKSTSYCPICEASYSPEATQVLDEKEDGHLMHIRCGNCSNAILASVSFSSTGVSSLGLVTDLSHHEVRGFSDAPAISTDDVLDAHHLLFNEDNLFAQLGIA